ncbi:MAG: alpha/beta hydrolase [Alphaproteobacteria bacterium]|nr:alpha/beta hydrolase [Alphaproteobacteria bacterium]
MNAIFHGYDQAQLDAQYNNRQMVPEYPAYLARWQADSETARRTARAELDLAYGPSAAETLDFFRAADQPANQTGGAPVVLFIHGGYWQALDKKDFSFVAPAFLAAGASVAVVNYALCPAATIDEIVRQMRACLVWLWRNARRFGGDPGRIHVTGHSAGGHLTAALMTTDWAAHGLPAIGSGGDPIAGGVAISGLYELESIRLTYLNKALTLDAESARRNSPVFDVKPLSAALPPLVLAVGQRESGEFHRQQSAFAAVWRAAGRSALEMDLPGRNHFSILDAFCDPSHALFRATLDQVSQPRASA